MPSISTARLHTRDHMSRVFSMAGQFAHVSVADIDSTLSEIYRDRFRCTDVFRENGRGAASDELVMLWRARAIPMMFGALGFRDVLSALFGHLCPLCYSVNRYAGYGGRRVACLVCPTFLRIRDDLSEGVLCGECWSSLHRVYGPGNWWLTDSEAILSGVAQLVTKSSFIKRTRSNAKRKLRFDPRRIRKRYNLSLSRQPQITDIRCN